MINLGGNTVVVVGFPRSGTSMMMRVLELGGIETIVDDEFRKSNLGDPYGIMEVRSVSKMLSTHDAQWTANKAFKLVTINMVYYPLDRPTKAIFMLRNIGEIVTSLLAKRLFFNNVDIHQSITYARRFLEEHKIPTVYFEHHEAIKYPKATCSQICDFLDADLDVANMLEGIDPSARKKSGEVGPLLSFRLEDAELDKIQHSTTVLKRGMSNA